MSASRENVRYFINYCWFTRDVTAAMLVVCWWSEQSISLLWEPYPTFMKILREKILFYWPPTHIQHGRLVTWLQTKKMLRWFILYLQTNDYDENKKEKVKKRIGLWAKQPLYTCISFFHTFLDVTARLLMRRFMGDVNIRRRILLSLFEPG